MAPEVRVGQEGMADHGSNHFKSFEFENEFGLVLSQSAGLDYFLGTLVRNITINWLKWAVIVKNWHQKSYLKQIGSHRQAGSAQAA